MGTVDDYLAELNPADAAVVGHVYDVAREAAPEATQGTSYGMPALVLDGKGLLSVMRARAHVGVYPYSAAVVSEVAPEVEAVPETSLAKGTIRFQPGHPLPDDVVRLIVRTRLAQIRGS